MNLTNIIQNINNYNITHIVASTNFFTKIELTNELNKNNLQSLVITTTVEEAKTIADYQKSVFLSQYEDLKMEPLVKTSSVVKTLSTVTPGFGKSNIFYSSSDLIKNYMLAHFENGYIIKNMDFCDVLILDSYDVGLINYTVIISLWQLALSFKFKVPKLVIITNVQMNIIDSNFTYTYENAISPNIEYLESDLSDNKIESMFESVKKILLVLLRKIIKNNKNIVIFVAGEKEINKFFKLLKNERIQNLEIIKIYNAKQSSGLFGILEKNAKQSSGLFGISKGNAKVIITNNTFELLNLFNIGYVIDTMYEQIQDLNLNKSLRYVNKSVSKDTAIKRCNYINDINGMCYRLCLEKFYDNLENNNISEISRIPIYNTILELINVGLNPETVLIDKNNTNVNECIKTLLDTNMITSDIKITEKGRFLYDLPLSNLMCQFLWMWSENPNKINTLDENKLDKTKLDKTKLDKTKLDETKLDETKLNETKLNETKLNETKLDETKLNEQKYSLFDAIVIACLIDCYGPTYIYLKKWDDESKKSYKAKNPNIIKGDNDLEILINIFNDLLVKNQGIEINNSVIWEWCNIHSVKQDKIVELLTNIKKCCDILSQKTNIELQIIDTSVIKLKAIPIFEILYSDMILTKTSKSNYKNLNSNKEYILDNKNLYQTLPKTLLALITLNNIIQLSINLPNTKHSISKIENNQLSNNNFKNVNNNFNKNVNFLYNIKIDTDKIDQALSLLDTIKIDNLFEIFDEPKNSLMELIDDLEI